MTSPKVKGCSLQRETEGLVTTLEESRLRGDVLVSYKLQNGLENIDSEQFFKGTAHQSMQEQSPMGAPREMTDIIRKCFKDY